MFDDPVLRAATVATHPDAGIVEVEHVCKELATLEEDARDAWDMAKIRGEHIYETGEAWRRADVALELAIRRRNRLRREKGGARA